MTLPFIQPPHVRDAHRAERQAYHAYITAKHAHRAYKRLHRAWVVAKARLVGVQG